MNRAELGDKIRELALVMLVALSALPIYVGYWAVVRGPELAGHPANGRAAARAAEVKPGRIMFELDGVPRDVAREAFVLAAAKLPIKTKFVARLGEEG